MAPESRTVDVGTPKCCVINEWRQCGNCGAAFDNVMEVRKGPQVALIVECAVGRWNNPSGASRFWSVGLFRNQGLAIDALAIHFCDPAGDDRLRGLFPARHFCFIELDGLVDFGPWQVGALFAEFVRPVRLIVLILTDLFISI